MSRTLAEDSRLLQSCSWNFLWHFFRDSYRRSSRQFSQNSSKDCAYIHSQDSNRVFSGMLSEIPSGILPGIPLDISFLDLGILPWLLREIPHETLSETVSKIPSRIVSFVIPSGLLHIILSGFIP